MGDYTYARCLFCETGKEMYVVRAIEDGGWGRAIFGQRVRIIKRDGRWTEVESPLFPSYVFVYSDLEDAHAADYRRVSHVLRVLSYENGDEHLIGGDLEFADWLWRMNGRIDVLKAQQIGERIEIIDGAFKELHGTILRLNKRQNKMLVALDTQSIPMQVWLSYEIVEAVAEGK